MSPEITKLFTFTASAAKLCEAVTAKRKALFDDLNRYLFTVSCGDGFDQRADLFRNPTLTTYNLAHIALSDPQLKDDFIFLFTGDFRDCDFIGFVNQILRDVE
jgi:hypothetical protein